MFQHSRLGIGTPDSTRYHNSSLSMTSPVSSYNTSELRTNRQRAMFASNHASGSPQMSTENHVGGPPTRGLFDLVDAGSVTSSCPSTSPLTHQSSFITGQLNQAPRQPNRSGANATFLDVPNMSSCSNNNESQGLLQWVTVFGFPMSALNSVISHMSSRVRIVDKHPAPHPQNNWIHLKCSVEQEAQRALTCNGDVVSGSIMIGVVPCTDEGVILGNDKENRTKLNGSMRMFSTPIKNSGTPKTRIPGARPLVANYPHSSPQTVKSPECVPQKSTGIVSKAMDYVFGW